MKHIKTGLICVLTLALILIAVLPAFYYHDYQDTATDGRYRDILTDIMHRSRRYENLYIDDDVYSDNLRNAVREVRLLTLSGGNLDYEQVRQAYNDFNEAAAAFRLSYVNAGENVAQNPALIHRLYIDDIRSAMDRPSNTFYFTMGRTPNRELSFLFYVENLDGEQVFVEILDENNEPFGWRFVPELNKEYRLMAHTRDSMYEYTIIFTMLPTVQIAISESIIPDVYRNSVITVTDPDFEYIHLGETIQTTNVFESEAGIKIRGGISRGFRKNSWSIKFWQASGSADLWRGDLWRTNNVSLFGLRHDSDWNLDAMYICRARMRCRVATDVWLDMSTPLHYLQEGRSEAVNGSRGVYVEVFLNDRYWGLYQFVEKIDRKQLSLDRNEDEVRSAIYKGRYWGYIILFRRFAEPNPNSSWWGGWEQRYPNVARGGAVAWDPLADLARFFAQSTDEEFAERIGEYILVQNFVEFTLLLMMTYALDNNGKNIYWWTYDMTNPNLRQIALTPWDMDATWGQYWNGNRVPRSSNRNWMNSASAHDSNLWRRLVLTNAGGFADKLRETWEREKHTSLSVERIVGRFEYNFNLLDISGAWERERIRWARHLDMADERAFIATWVAERWEYLDDLIQNRLDQVGTRRGR